MAPTDAERQMALVLAAVIMTSVSVLVVGVRVIIRAFVMRKPGMDDYTIVAAVCLTLGYTIEILLEKHHRIGFPASTLTTAQMQSQLKVTLSIQVTYPLVVGFIKTSIVYLYLRFAISEGFRVLCYGTIIFTVIFTIMCVCVTVGQCTPVEKLWDLTGTLPGSCINTTVFFYFTSGFNILTDIWILVLPIKTLRLVNRPAREQIALGVIFGAGAVATTFSCVRLQSIYVYTLSKDPFRDGISVNFWSIIEVNIAILCASVPALRPLATPRRLRELRQRRHYYHQNQYPAPKHDEESSAAAGGEPLNRPAFGFVRKGSHGSLYPDLETYNLTTLSSPGDAPERPSSAHARPGSSHEVDYFGTRPAQPAFHIM